MDSQDYNVILAPEAEGMISSLNVIPFEEIGSPRWNTQHEYLEQLHRQAVISAKLQGDEFVKEYLVTYEKLPALVYDLITTGVWKSYVFPELKQFKLSPTFPVYLVLYHEAVVLTLLETVLFHEESAESLGDVVTELVDYCYRHLTYQLAQREAKEMESGEDSASEEEEEEETADGVKELEKQRRSIEFDLAVTASSVLQYIAMHLEHLPLGATNQVLDRLDVPLLMVSLIEKPPWMKEEDGKLFKYVDKKWEEFDPSERWKLTKTEGQIWMALYQLLLSEHASSRYEITYNRKNTLMKLQGYLNEVVLDQVPQLSALLQYLSRLALTEAPPVTKKDLIIEEPLDIRENLVKKYDGKWQKMAKRQYKEYFRADRINKDQAKRLVDMYTNEFVENLILDPPKCVLCGSPAAKRCSRCKEEWYCGRECQVKHWKKHKQACDMVMNVKKGLEEESKKVQQTAT